MNIGDLFTKNNFNKYRNQQKNKNVKFYDKYISKILTIKTKIILELPYLWLMIIYIE